MYVSRIRIMGMVQGDPQGIVQESEILPYREEVYA